MRYAVRSVGSAHPASRPEVGSLHRAVAFCCFTLLLMFNVALPALMFGGYPVRGLLAVALLAILCLVYGDAAERALRKHALIFYLAACLAVLGTFVSIVNGTDAGVIVKVLTEVHLQAAVMLLVAAILADVCGAETCAEAIIGTIAITAAVAVLQMLKVQGAWQIRDLLGDVQNYVADEVSSLGKRRPTGLSYSAIQLATQLCLAFAVYGAVREKRRAGTADSGASDPAILVALGLFLVASIASGTRSAILGGMLFMAVYALTRRGSWVPVALAVGGLAVLVAWPMIMAILQTAQPRVTSVDDGSAVGRTTLAYFGLRLFLDNPLGYGLGFKPFDHWSDYWDILYQLPNAWHAQSRLLHNYPLSMLNIYGVGVLLIAPLVVGMLVRARSSLIFFIPYVVQILFHNAGPFWNDIILWFVVATIAVVPDHRSIREGGVQPLPRRGRFRRFQPHYGPRYVRALSGELRTPPAE